MILCCGEALIDMLPGQSQGGKAAFVPHAGGSVFNTALALGRLGVPSGLWCGLSTDLFGQQLRAALSASQVDSSLCPISDRPTTLAFVSLVDGQARYAFYDENTAARMVTPEMLPELSTAVEALFFGGISLVADPCGSAHEALCLRESAQRPVMIDPNIRPAFIADEAAYRARLGRMLARADIVKVSEEDALWLVPAHSPDGAAAEILAAGPRIVLVTKGAEGAVAFAPGIRIALPAPRVVPVDTVGAGDAFNAGFLAALRAEDQLDKDRIAALPAPVLSRCLAQAIRIAALSTLREGADPPWHHELAATAERLDAIAAGAEARQAC